MKTRLTGADGVRAFACLMVMAHHAVLKLNPAVQIPIVGEAQAFFLTGSAGVAVFFVLSGYLLSSPFWRAWGDDSPRPSMKTFALRRWARIAPAFWLNLILTFVISLYVFPEAPDQLRRFITGLTFTSSLSWETLFPVEINGPLWSVSYEVFSYVLLGACAIAWFLLPGRRTIRRGLAYWIGVLVVALLGHSLMLAIGQTDLIGKGWEYGSTGGAKYWWPTYNPIGFFATFVLGILAAGVCDTVGRNSTLIRGRLRWSPDIFVVAAVAATIALLWLVRHEPDFAFSWPAQPYYFPIFPLLVAAILALSPHTRLIGRLLDNRAARYVATISFGLYIWHDLLLEGSKLIWPTMTIFGIDDPVDWFVKITAVYAVAFVVATVSWYRFEKPIVEWSQGRRKTPVLPPTG
jgi:peptidoglycan/LPS O-acetylase OafA/YrhL